MASTTWLKMEGKCAIWKVQAQGKETWHFTMGIKELQFYCENFHTTKKEKSKYLDDLNS